MIDATARQPSVLRIRDENDKVQFLEIGFEFFFRFSGLNGNGSGNRKNENRNGKNNKK
jgi:hypothetical protein